MPRYTFDSGSSDDYDRPEGNKTLRFIMHRAWVLVVPLIAVGWYNARQVVPMAKKADQEIAAEKQKSEEQRNKTLTDARKVGVSISMLRALSDTFQVRFAKIDSLIDSVSVLRAVDTADLKKLEAEGESLRTVFSLASGKADSLSKYLRPCRSTSTLSRPSSPLEPADQEAGSREADRPRSCRPRPPPGSVPQEQCASDRARGITRTATRFPSAKGRIGFMERNLPGPELRLKKGHLWYLFDLAIAAAIFMFVGPALHGAQGRRRPRGQGEDQDRSRARGSAGSPRPTRSCSPNSHVLAQMRADSAAKVAEYENKKVALEAGFVERQQLTRRMCSSSPDQIFSMNDRSREAVQRSQEYEKDVAGRKDEIGTLSTSADETGRSLAASREGAPGRSGEAERRASGQDLRARRALPGQVGARGAQDGGERERAHQRGAAAHVPQGTGRRHRGLSWSRSWYRKLVRFETGRTALLSSTHPSPSRI